MVLGSGIRDPGSGKNLFRIPDPGVKKHPIPDPGSGSATLGIGKAAYRIMAIDVFSSLNFVVVFNLNVFPFPSSKAQFVGI
jgi:hypothetical protein